MEPTVVAMLQVDFSISTMCSVIHGLMLLLECHPSLCIAIDVQRGCHLSSLTSVSLVSSATIVRCQIHHETQATHRKIKIKPPSPDSKIVRPNHILLLSNEIKSRKKEKKKRKTPQVEMIYFHISRSPHPIGLSFFFFFLSGSPPDLPF